MGLAGRLDDAGLEFAAKAACATVARRTHDEQRVRMLARRGFSVLGPAANVAPRALAGGRWPLVLVWRRDRALPRLMDRALAAFAAHHLRDGG